MEVVVKYNLMSFRSEKKIDDEMIEGLEFKYLSNLIDQSYL